MSCTELDPITGCYTLADGSRQNVTIHYEYGKGASGAAVVSAVRITDAVGVIIPLADATNTTAGACPVAQPDVEWSEQCDTLANGSVVPFMRQVITSFDASGMAIVPSAVADYELDKITPYAVAGTVGLCPACSAAVPVGLVTTWG